MHARRVGLVSAYLSLTVLVALVLSGCLVGGQQGEGGFDPDASVEATGDTGLPQGTSGSPETLMMGRSVLADWFAHWGWAGSGSVERDGHVAHYAPIAEPPQSGTSAAEGLELIAVDIGGRCDLAGLPQPRQRIIAAGTGPPAVGIGPETETLQRFGQLARTGRIFPRGFFEPTPAIDELLQVGRTPIQLF